MLRLAARIAPLFVLASVITIAAPSFCPACVTPARTMSATFDCSRMSIDSRTSRGAVPDTSISEATTSTSPDGRFGLQSGLGAGVGGWSIEPTMKAGFRMVAAPKAARRTAISGMPVAMNPPPAAYPTWHLMG